MSTIDIRSKIHQIVSSITPLDYIEEEDIHFVLNWIESGCEIFRIEKPATPETHLVSYFVISSHSMDQIKKSDPNMVCFIKKMKDQTKLRIDSMTEVHNECSH